MNLLSDQLEIPKDDPFKNDLLGRKAFADRMIKIIKNSPEGPVISLNAKWGAGKTTFTKMWRNHFSNSGGQSVYINTFDKDYVDNPFLLLSSAICNGFQDQFKDEIENFKKASIQVGKNIISWGLKTAVKSATFNIVNEESLKELSTAIIESTTESTGVYLEEKITNFEDEDKDLKDFRKRLSLLGESTFQKTGYPLVIILDELDRCRPSFAIETIERIKHFFSVPNVSFLLVMNREQIEQSVCATYGIGVDATTYLQKFIDFEMLLETNLKKNSVDHYNFIKFCMEQTECNWFDQKMYVAEDLSVLSKVLQLSWRDIKKIVLHLSMLFKSIDELTLKISKTFVLLCIIKVKYPDLFGSLKGGTLTLLEAANKIKLLEKLKLSDFDDLEFLDLQIQTLSMDAKKIKELDKDDRHRNFAENLYSRFHVRDTIELPSTFCEWIDSFNFLK